VESERLHVVIRGEVQGVGFRFFLLRRARSSELHGWVRNRDDGTVELVAEGRRTDLDQLLAAARTGPQLADVAEVDVEWGPAAGGLGAFALIG
jgi:acylphosphatase